LSVYELFLAKHGSRFSNGSIMHPCSSKFFAKASHLGFQSDCTQGDLIFLAIQLFTALHPTVKLAAREYICRDYFSALNARHRDLSARNLVF
jgi:hypothetical protein